MAMVPYGTREGDFIGFMQGSPVPHIPRPSEESGCYTFWGDGYGHGIMQGEAMELDKT